MDKRRVSPEPSRRGGVRCSFVERDYKFEVETEDS